MKQIRLAALILVGIGCSSFMAACTRASLEPGVEQGFLIHPDDPADSTNSLVPTAMKANGPPPTRPTPTVLVCWGMGGEITEE